MSYRGSRSAAEAVLAGSVCNIGVDHVVTYSGFTPNDTTWHTMQSGGGFTLRNTGRLLPRIVRLYEQGYPGAEEWAHINRDFVLRQMIPYVDGHAPFVGVAEDPLTVAGMHQTLPKLASEPRYLNLVRTGRIYKAAQRVVVLGLRDAAQRVADAIGEELAGD